MKKKITVMTKMERIAAAIRGDAVDTVPYSLWFHLPLIDLDPVKNAEQTYGFYKTYDVDILKTMNNGKWNHKEYGTVSTASPRIAAAILSILVITVIFFFIFPPKGNRTIHLISFIITIPPEI